MTTLTKTEDLSPAEIVHELDQHIVGQKEAKRAVALALRNRWRRMQVEPNLRNEISPKNILMIGPTGVGKTEIARRLAKLANAPFLKVEATKFTEVGYVGRDVESIIRDLADTAIKMYREQAITQVKEAAESAAIERILDALLRPDQKRSSTATATTNEDAEFKDPFQQEAEEPVERNSTRQLFRKKLLNHELDAKEIEIDIAATPVGVEIMAPPGMEEMTSQLSNMFSSLNNNRTKSKRMRIDKAFKILKEEEAQNLINDDEIKQHAVDAVEQNGIVFLDEIDKVTKRSDSHGGGDVSREGVQRDLLPLIEGCTVTTKYGSVKTDHILFIASGAFHLAKPSDLVPELQGRLPIRVELQALTTEDFQRILTEPNASLTQQYAALLKTEGLDIKFSDCGIKQLAQTAWKVNERTENIGARRLHTVLEKVLEETAFDAVTLADKQAGKPIIIDATFVDSQLKELSEDEDLSRYIL